MGFAINQSDKMKTLAIILIIVAILGIVLSVFPNFGLRENFSGRQNFNNTQMSNQGNNAGFAFSGAFTFLRLGLWIVVLVIGVLLAREPSKKK